jgi:foldase protein PrsA
VSRRFLAVILSLVIAVAAGSAAGCGSGSSDAVVTVGNSAITEEDLNYQLEQTAASYGLTQESNPEEYAALRAELLEYMIENETALQKAPGLGLTVTDEELQTQIDLMVAQGYEGDQSLLEDAIATADMTMDEFRADYKEYLLVQKVYEQVKAGVTVSDEEVSAFYEENKDLYHVEDSRTVRHILIAPGADDSEDDTSTTTTVASDTTTTSVPTDAEWAEALATAQEVREKLVAGGDWTELAAEYSDDPGSKDSGGDLGEVTVGEMVPEFDDVAFSLDAYEISQPVKSSYGYHVIQVTGITQAYTKPLEDVAESIRSTLLTEAQYAAWDAWIAAARTELGVTYREDMQPTTTTVTESTDTTATTESTETTEAAETTTTAAPSATTTTLAD